MTSTVPGAAPAPLPPAPAPRRRAAARPESEPDVTGSLTGLDLLAGAALLLVGLLGWASLALAHGGRHSLLAVLVVTLVALGLVVLVARRAARPGFRADLPGVAVALGCAAVAAALTFPGFSYGVAEKDPGGYVAHAHMIERTGDHAFVDPALSARLPDGSPLPVQLTSPGARFGGVWIRGAQEDGLIVPQFYHLWPALLATSLEVGGLDALRFTVPLMGVLAVLCLVAVVRRVGDQLMGRTAGLVAAATGGLLLATNMLQVWQARFPSTEVLAEALYLGSLLGIVVSLQTRWRPAAGLAGLFVGIGWLNRADGILLVGMVAALGGALLATRRWDSRATWFAGGLLLTAPHAWWQAYDRALYYSNANSVPSWKLFTAALAACLLGGLVLGAVRPLGRGVLALVQRRRAQVVLGLLTCAVCAGLLALGFLRSRIFGPDFFDYNGRLIPSYDEQIMRRLSWFFTLPGFALFGLGIAVVALRRWRAAAWAIVLPTIALFAVYGYTAKNSTRMLWWTRRYVPTVMPGLLMLIALAIAFAFVWRYRGRLVLRVPAVLATGALVTAFLAQSVPLRSHDEWKGSFEIAAQIADLSGDATGVYLWEGQPCCNRPTQLFATPVWLTEGELSIRLPDDPARRQEIVDLYARQFAGQPVFVVADGTDLPTGLDGNKVAPVTNIVTTLPMWDESDTARPAKPREIPVEIAIWRVAGT
ncbi:MAG: hypothetical protein Q8R60_01330 [Mycobacteriales bacterium]|nr:hypothetical protein [Mycobacteriales bacterium]